MPSPASLDSNWTSRLWWTLAGVGLLDWSFRIVNYAPEFSWAAWIALLSGAWGLGTVLFSWAPQLAGRRAGRYSNALAWATALITVLCFGIWAAIFVHGIPSYGTDELAFDQYAGVLAQHGANPYVHSMLPAFPMFQVSPAGYTYTLAGQQVTQLSYPALSFLLYVPFLALGWSRQLGVGLDVLGWGVSTMILFIVLPRRMRGSALVLGSALTYTQLSVIGLTDMLFMPMLMLAAYRWDRFGNGWRTYLGPVMLGLAMAVKQTPWPVLPFVLLALALDERARTDLKHGAQRAGRYFLAVVLAFLIPNLPYIIAAPSAWWSGTFTPLTKSLVPAGQGMIVFSLFLHLGGGSLTAYSLLLGLVLILLLVMFVGTYPLMRLLLFALPAIAYFFAVRSYTDYLIALVPPGIVAAVTADPSLAPISTRLIKSRPWLISIGVLLVACVAISIKALTASSPLAVTITNVDTTGATNIGEQVYATVANHTDRTVKPAFTLETASGVSTFWTRLKGPRRLGPHATANYMLGSPNTDSQFTVNGGTTLLAFLSKPASVSVSNRYQPQLWSVGYSPQAFNSAITVGDYVILRTQLLNEWDEPIHKAYVPVTLSQSVATPQQSVLSDCPKQPRPKVASINGADAGHDAMSLTNANGVAMFVIIAKQPTYQYPDTLSATVPSGPPYDYIGTSAGTTQLRIKSAPGEPASPPVQQCATG